jgi:hypothetical protein
MELCARKRVIVGVAPMLISLLLASPVAAQKPKNNYLRDMELCNGPLEPRIDGCTALIDSGQGTTTSLAIAHNNRGNAYIAKGDSRHPGFQSIDQAQSNFLQTLQQPRRSLPAER